MTVRRTLVFMIALPLALLFHLAVARDTQSSQAEQPPDTVQATGEATDQVPSGLKGDPHAVDPGASARMRAIKRRREAEAEQQQLAEQKRATLADTLNMSMPQVDDRGVYRGKGRDTRGAVHLLRAGEIRQIRNDRGEISIIQYSVKLIQDSLTMWCDSARYRQYAGVLDMYGDVLMVDPNRSLSADKVSYFERTRQSVANGNVVIERDSLVMTCDRAQYDDISDMAIFEDRMIARDLPRKIVLTGEQGIFWTERQYGRVPQDPVLITLDSLGNEDARIVSEYMEYDALNGYALARDSVTISWRKVRGWAKELKYYPDDARALLVGDPRVTHNRDEVLGDSIWLYMNEESLDSAVVVGQAIAWTASDTTGIGPRSSLRGKKIVLDFQDGEVRQMSSKGQAVGIYHVFQEGNDQGSNRVSGDEVILQIEEGELNSVIVVGGTEGMFYPPRLARELRDE